MANTERGEVRLEVDGTGYILKLTLTHIVALQKKTNRPMGLILDAVKNLDIEMIAAVTWAALQPNHPRQFKTIDSVVDLMETAGGLDQLSVFVLAIAELVTRKTTESSDVEANPPTAQPGGTVASSISEPEPIPA